METITLSTPTIHCHACEANISEALEEVPGVRETAVDLDAKRVTVTFEAGETDAATIAAAVEEAGYPVAGPTG